MTIEIINYGETNSTNIPGTPWTRHFFLRIVVRFENWISIWLHSDVAHSGSTEPPPPSLSICFRFIVSRSFYTRSQIRILFSSFLFFFEKKGWRKWMKTDLIMMILIMMILIRRGGPGKSNANNNHLLSAVECIFGLFDAIIILLPTITNKP